MIWVLSTWLLFILMVVSLNYQIKQERMRRTYLDLLDSQEQLLIDIESWQALGFGDKAIEMGKYNINKSRKAALEQRNKVWPRKKRRRTLKPSFGTSVYLWQMRWVSRLRKTRTVIRSMLRRKQCER
ncbi:hypothetical protein PBI_CLEO_60 [Gordonia phage Cleo]|nr:hypothetical protein PBI_CLEO_60 [Gordonia phage Cleo]